MALPSVGGNYATTMAPGLNPLAIRKGIVTDAFVRDYLGVSTSLAAASAGLHTDGYFSPYALDGQVRTDLLRTSPTSNLGFWYTGTLGADGLDFDPQTTSEEVPTAQSIRPARNDITKEGEMFSLTFLEQTPMVRYLVNEMPLVSVPDLGQANLTIPRPMEATIVERQFILFGFDGENRFAMTIPRCAKDKVNKFVWKREGKEGTGVKIDFKVLPCPFVNKPVLEHFEGSAWRAMGGYAVFPAPAPVATAVSGQKASIVFTQPTGIADPFTYQVYKTGIAPAVARTLATLDAGFPTTVGTTVTAQVTTIGTGNTFKFDVVATGSNLLTSQSLDSNTITGIA